MMVNGQPATDVDCPAMLQGGRYDGHPYDVAAGTTALEFTKPATIDGEPIVLRDFYRFVEERNGVAIFQHTEQP